MEIRLFDVDTAVPRELTDYHQLVVATAPDWSNNAPTDYDSVIDRARSTSSVFGPITRWAAHVEGTLVGSATASLPEDAGTHVAVLRIDVHPAHRDRGVGTGLLRHVATECRALGRSALETWSLPAGRVGERWAWHRGFATVNTTVNQRLVMSDVDPATWQVDAPAGYHAATWAGAAPDDLVASYAHASDAIHDAPFGEASFEFPQWTVGRMRAEEARLAEAGVTQWVVAAVRDADNEIAGFTELRLRPGRTDAAVVNNTAVLREHRGHGLGMFVKALMSAWLHEQRPDYQSIVTSTAANNEHMIRINERIGFRTELTAVVVNAGIDALNLDPESETRETIH